MATQATMDGVQHRLIAGMDAKEGAIATDHSNIDGYENTKGSAIYEQQFPDGSKEAFHIGGIDTGNLNMTPQSMDAVGQAMGDMGITRVEPSG